MGGFSFICFSYTAERDLVCFFYRPNGEGEEKSWIFNFNINISTKFKYEDTSCAAVGQERVVAAWDGTRLKVVAVGLDMKENFCFAFWLL